MNDINYYAGLARETGLVFRSYPNLYDHRDHHPWLAGALGDPGAGIWFVAENPSLAQVERVRDPDGRTPTVEAQWWASEGDKLFRRMLVKHRFKSGTIDSRGGRQCYITNVIKEADYTKNVREKTQNTRNQAAEIWASVLRWELENCHPRLVVVMGKQTQKLLGHLMSRGKIQLPWTENLTHYAYIGQRAQGNLGPMHPVRVQAYDEEFMHIRRIYDSLTR